MTTTRTTIDDDISRILPHTYPVSGGEVITAMFRACQTLNVTVLANAAMPMGTYGKYSPRIQTISLPSVLVPIAFVHEVTHAFDAKDGWDGFHLYTGFARHEDMVTVELVAEYTSHMVARCTGIMDDIENMMFIPGFYRSFMDGNPGVDIDDVSARVHLAYEFIMSEIMDHA